MANYDTAPNESEKLSIEDRFEIVDELLACNCIYDTGEREVVLQQLVDKFEDLVNAVPQTNTNKTNVVGLVSTCLKHPGSLEELVRIVAYLEGETNIHAQRLRRLIHTRLVSPVIDLDLFDELTKLTANLHVEIKDLQTIYLLSLPIDRVHELSKFKKSDETRMLSLMLRELAWEDVQNDHTHPLLEFITHLSGYVADEVRVALIQWRDKTAKVVKIETGEENSKSEEGSRTEMSLLEQGSPVLTQKADLPIPEQPQEITVSNTSFATLIHWIITILTSYIPSIHKAPGTDVGDDYYRQSKDLFEALEQRFKQATTDGKAVRVLENFLLDPEEYSDNLQRKLTALLPNDQDFAYELRQIVSRPLVLQRQQELQLYREFLARETPWIWIVTALERSGKTELLQQLEKNTPTGIPVVCLDFAHERYQFDPSTGKREPIDALSYLRIFARQVQGACDPHQFNEFQKELAKTYEASNRTITNQIIQAHPDTALSDISLLQYDRRQARERVTQAFHDLMESFWPGRLVIQLDTCEWLMDAVNTEARRWLVEGVLLPLHNSLRSRRKQCHVVLMSSVTLALPFLESKDRRHTSLSPLGKLSVQHYLQRIGVEDPALCHLLYEMTGGHASCVSLLCELWYHWQEEGKPLSSGEPLIQFQKAFYEKAGTEFIRQQVLEKFSDPDFPTSRRSPLYTLTKYGCLLREFDLAQLKRIFGNIELPEAEVEMAFHQLIQHCYIVPCKERHKYAFHELFRTVLGQYVREQERDRWGDYHKRYMDFFQFQTDASRLLFSTDWHYHNLGYRLALDENEELARRYWTETLTFFQQQGVAPTPLVEAACDKTLMFTSIAYEAQHYQLSNS